MLKTAITSLALFAAPPSIAAIPSHSPVSLNFRKLEFEQPRDPLLGSNVVFSEVHHTPASQLEDARAALMTAIPIGTPRSLAEATLRNAGARCIKKGGSEVDNCRFFDLETVDEFFDDVSWTVRMNIVNGRTAGVSIDRTWQRH